MHIPDSILSPATSALAGAAMLPVWTVAARRVRKSLGARQIPLLALGAAFCFVIMMFNIPALGGTTAHPVAGTLVAVALGPWAAVIAMSVALAIQALFFADGGLLAYGANCFTMAFALPFVGYAVYRLLAGRSGAKTPMRAIAAAVGAYAGINVAAALVAVLLGIQPALYHNASGEALYFPFGLRVTLPAMLGTHLMVAGPAEAIVTGLVVRYLQAAGIPLYGTGSAVETGKRKRGELLWVNLLAVAALSPLGLLAKGDAWGEWDSKGLSEQIRKTEGRAYVPEKIREAEGAGYKGVRGLEDYGSDRGVKGYLPSALLGISIIAGLMLLGGRLLVSRNTPPLGTDSADIQRANPDSAPADLVSPDSVAVRADSPSVPDWMRRPSDAGSPASEQNAKPPNRFLERTLAEFSSGAAETLYSEHWTRRKGMLQSLDPRAKVFGLVGLIAVISFIHNPYSLLALYALTVALGIGSRLPLGVMARRVWLSVPLFVGAIALPACLNVVIPGRVLFVLWRHPFLAVTTPGALAGAVLMLRVGVAVSLAALLTLTTPWNDLLRALRAFFVPRLFIGVLAMTYRYIAVLMQTAAEMFVARRSRTIGRVDNAQGRKFVGASVGALFGKTMALSEEVHDAMTARGFQGNMPTLAVSRWRRADTLWTAAMALAALAALGEEYVRFLH